MALCLLPADPKNLSRRFSPSSCDCVRIRTLSSLSGPLAKRNLVTTNRQLHGEGSILEVDGQFRLNIGRPKMVIATCWRNGGKVLSLKPLPWLGLNSTPGSPLKIELPSAS